MKSKNFILIVIILVFDHVSFAQLGPCLKDSEHEYYTDRAKDQVLNYYSALNLIGGNGIEYTEKGTIIYETMKMFEDEQGFVVNDIIPHDTLYPDNFKVKEYLENIRLFYANSTVEFDIDSIKVSNIYKAQDFYFLKVEVQRIMIIKINNRQNKTRTHLDFYIKFIPRMIDCQIYSIRKHENNMDEFEKVAICDEEGSLILKSNPEGADVTFTDLPQIKCVTPCNLKNLKPGIYSIKFIKKGFYPIEKNIIVKSNETNEFSATFVAMPDTLGSFVLNTVPDGATISIRQKPAFHATTPFTLEDYTPGKLNINFDKKGYGRYSQEIEILPNRVGNLNVKLNQVKQKNAQLIWLSGAVITAAAGGYFKHTADQKYNEYLESNNSDEAADLKKEVQLYDKLTIGSFSLAGICTIGFTISTIKKGKAKKSYAHVEMNGQGARLTYNF
jgi:hypothetical protein